MVEVQQIISQPTDLLQTPVAFGPGGWGVRKVLDPSPCFPLVRFP